MTNGGVAGIRPPLHCRRQRNDLRSLDRTGTTSLESAAPVLPSGADYGSAVPLANGTRGITSSQRYARDHS
jgi:hypothetical protein